MLETPLCNALPRQPAMAPGVYPWRPLMTNDDMPPEHPRCRCSTVLAQGGAVQLKEDRYVWSMTGKSTDRDTRSCTCDQCWRVYGSRGVVSPFRAVSCPWRNSSYADVKPYTHRVEYGKAPKTLTITGIDHRGNGIEENVTISWLEEVAPFTQADWDKAKSRLGGTWHGTDQRDTIREGIDRLWSHIEPSKIEGVFSGTAESIIRKVLSAYSLTPAELGITTNHQGRSSMDCPFGPGCPICSLRTPKPQGEQRMSPTISPVSSLADEVRRLGKDHNVDLSTISSAIKRAEDERKELVMSALRSMARLEKAKNRHEGKEFVLVYQYAGDEYAVHGVDFASGQDISKDDETDAYRVFLNEPEGIDNCYYTMPLMKEALKNTSYVVEYLD